MRNINALVRHQFLQRFPDNYMIELCERYPELDVNYGLSKNMGYGTKQHIEGIVKHGYTLWHRKSLKIKSS